MVNLLVVALLLVSCLATRVAHVKKFQLLCKRPDGSHAPMPNVAGEPYEPKMRGALGTVVNFFGAGQAKRFGTESFKTDENGELSARWEDANKAADVKLGLMFYINCQISLRSECPTIDARCKEEEAKGSNVILYGMKHDGLEQQWSSGNGYCSLTGLTAYDCDADRAEMSKNPITYESFCSGEKGPCSYSQNTQQSSNQQTIIKHATNTNTGSGNGAGPSSNPGGSDPSSNPDTARVAHVKKFQLLCKRPDGSHAPMPNVAGEPYEPKMRGALGTVVNFFGAGQAKRFGTESFKTDENGELSARWEDANKAADVKLGLMFYINCQISLRSECPTIDARCKEEEAKGSNVILYGMKHDGLEQQWSSGNGYCSLTGLTAYECDAGRAEMSKNPITYESFCSGEKGPCSYSQNTHQSSNQQTIIKHATNIDKRAATADFNKGRPTRLAKGLF